MCGLNFSSRTAVTQASPPLPTLNCPQLIVIPGACFGRVDHDVPPPDLPPEQWRTIAEAPTALSLVWCRAGARGWSSRTATNLSPSHHIRRWLSRRFSLIFHRGDRRTVDRGDRPLTRVLELAPASPCWHVRLRTVAKDEACTASILCWVFQQIQQRGSLEPQLRPLQRHSLLESPQISRKRDLRPLLIPVRHRVCAGSAY